MIECTWFVMLYMYFQTCFSGLNIDVLTAVFLSVQVFWDMTLFHWVSGFWPLKIRAVHCFETSGASHAVTASCPRRLCLSRHGVHRAESAACPLENKCYWYYVLLHSVRERALYKLFWNYRSFRNHKTVFWCGFVAVSYVKLVFFRACIYGTIFNLEF